MKCFSCQYVFKMCSPNPENRMVKKSGYLYHIIIRMSELWKSMFIIAILSSLVGLTNSWTSITDSHQNCMIWLNGPFLSILLLSIYKLLYMGRFNEMLCQLVHLTLINQNFFDFNLVIDARILYGVMHCTIFNRSSSNTLDWLVQFMELLDIRRFNELDFYLEEYSYTDLVC